MLSGTPYLGIQYLFHFVVCAPKELFREHMSFAYVEEKVAVWNVAVDDHLANPGHHHLEPWELPLSIFPSMGSLVTGLPLDGRKNSEHEWRGRRESPFLSRPGSPCDWCAPTEENLAQKNIVSELC